MICSNLFQNFLSTALPFRQTLMDPGLLGQLSVASPGGLNLASPASGPVLGFEATLCMGAPLLLQRWAAQPCDPCSGAWMDEVRFTSRDSAASRTHRASGASTPAGQTAP